LSATLLASKAVKTAKAEKSFQKIQQKKQNSKSIEISKKSKSK